MNNRSGSPLTIPKRTKQIIRPTYHYLSLKIKVSDDENAKPVPVSELVAKNQVLISFPPVKESGESVKRKEIQAGENTEWSEDGNSILSTIPGYPRCLQRRKINSAKLVETVEIEPLFFISPDEMKATVALHPEIPGGHTLKNEEIDTLLEQNNVMYGIDPKARKTLSALLQKELTEFSKLDIAFGTPAKDPRHASLHFEIEIGPIAGEILEDGSIDFRERRVMVGVTEGQCIATKIPPLPGTPGMNVSGREIPARQGRDISIHLLNDVKFFEKTNQVKATKSGTLSIVNNNVIKVLSHEVIHDDVNFKTGNIDTENNLTIQGSVQPGFKVAVNGDIKIGGGIYSGQVHCKGNLVVRGGITGKQSDVHADGDIDLHFVEQGTIRCGGICVVRIQAYYSKITANGVVRCQPRSKIMGGEIFSQESITLYDVGGEAARPACIAAGIVPQRLRDFMARKTLIIQKQEEIVAWEQKYPGSSSSKKVKKMEQELAELRFQQLRANLIPGTGQYSRAAKPGEKKIAEPGDCNEKDYSTVDAIDIQKIAIDVFGTIFAETELRIGNQTMKLNKTISQRRFKLNETGKRIIAVPLGRGKS